MGSRWMVIGGARIGRGVVLGAGSFLDPSIPVFDAETGEELSRGVVPPWCVAIRASRRREYPGGEFFVPCVLVIKRLTEGERHDKAQLNAVLRDHGASTWSEGGPISWLPPSTWMAMPAVSGEEDQIAWAVQKVLAGCPWLDVERVGDNVVARHLPRA